MKLSKPPEIRAENIEIKLQILDLRYIIHKKYNNHPKGTLAINQISKCKNQNDNLK